MTQEDKELLLKDISARLPYNVRVEYNGTTFTNIFDVLGIAHGRIVLCLPFMSKTECPLIEEVKPYLFPLSSMTLEQRCKLRDLLPNNCDISFKNQKITFYDEGNIRLEQLEKLFHFFNLFHLDYRGLIPKGLAIDATGLNIY